MKRLYLSSVALFLLGLIPYSAASDESQEPSEKLITASRILATNFATRKHCPDLDIEDKWDNWMILVKSVYGRDFDYADFGEGGKHYRVALAAYLVVHNQIEEIGAEAVCNIILDIMVTTYPEDVKYLYSFRKPD